MKIENGLPEFDCIELAGTVSLNLKTSLSRYRDWTDGNGNLLSTGTGLEVGTAGVYRLTATSPGGCAGEDEITMKQSEQVLRADFVISSDIPENKEIHAVNIMQTDFDSIRWILPGSVHVSGMSAEKASLTFPRTGEYAVGLQAFLGSCQNVLYKTVRVVPPSEIAEYNDSEPFLKHFVVFPNPNNGDFSALVELREPADNRLTISD